MIESEHHATSDDSPPASNAPRSVRASLIVPLSIAAAFVASDWFFFQQGQRDAEAGSTNAVTAAMHDATTPPTDTVAQPAGANDSTTVPATAAGSAQPAADAVNTGPVAHRSSTAAKAKPAAKKSSLASSAKPSRSVVVEPENRTVALLGYPKPAYPREALREHEQGTVLVLAQVDVHGHVSDARVIRHSGSFALDRAATNEVRSWQFQPALHDGKPVVASVQVPVNYRLDH